MKKGLMSHDARHTARARRLLAAATIGITSLALASCTPHRVAANYKCPGVTAHKTVVFTSRKGGIGLAKVGVTPAGLKLQQKCQTS